LSDQAKCLIFGKKSSEIGCVLVLDIPFWGQNCRSKDSQKIALGLNGPFGDQKVTFKTVLGPVPGLCRHYYSELSWSDKETPEKAGLVTTYDATYKLLSGTIHVNARDLEQYLELDDAGEIKKILWGPDVQEIDFILFTAAETMMFVLVAISRVFTLTYEEPWQLILDTYNNLGHEFNKGM